MAARLNTIVAIAMLALYDEFDTYWQNGGYKKISDIIFAECHIFIVSNLWCYHDNNFRYFMFGKYNGFVSKARPQNRNRAEASPREHARTICVNLY